MSVRLGADSLGLVTLGQHGYIPELGVPVGEPGSDFSTQIGWFGSDQRTDDSVALVVSGERDVHSGVAPGDFGTPQVLAVDVEDQLGPYKGDEKFYKTKQNKIRSLRLNATDSHENYYNFGSYIRKDW